VSATVKDPPIQHRFRDNTGLEIRVRSETPDDATHLIDIFENLSPLSRYRRFNEPLENADPLLVRQGAVRLASLDPAKGKAWLAFADLPGRPNAPVGGARYALIEPGVAEIAVTVRDDLQRRGIGSQLMNFVLHQAKAAGITALVARFQASNQSIWRMLGYSPYQVTWEFHGGEVDAVIHLNTASGPHP